MLRMHLGQTNNKIIQRWCNTGTGVRQMLGQVSAIRGQRASISGWCGDGGGTAGGEQEGQGMLYTIHVELDMLIMK